MIKLYETNSELNKNETVVTFLEEKDGEYYIGLEESIFFPEEGGQNADTGRLITSDGREIQLLDGQIVPDTFSQGIIYKVSDRIEAGEKVECILDYDKRFDRMQNHSGEHVLTGVIHNKYGFDNVGFHLSDESYVTLDLNGTLSYEELMEMEKEANRVIYANLPIIDSYPDKKELASLEYRSKIEIEGQVRLITIGDENETVDVCACCAPHVKTTGQIGIIKVIGMINWKGGVRISMLAGRRALEYINSEHEIIRKLTGLLTTSAENILDITRSHIDEINILKGKLVASYEEKVINKLEYSMSSESRKGNHIEFVDSEFPVISQKNIYNYLLEHFDGYVAIMSGDDKEGYRYFGGSREKDSRELAKALKEKFDAKGGGKEDMVQGFVKAGRAELIELMDTI